MKTRRMRKNKRTRSKRGGGGCFGAFCSTNNAMKNIINVSKMDVVSLARKVGDLSMSRARKEIELEQVSDPKQKAKLKKEIDQLNGEIKLYENEFAKKDREQKESMERSKAILQSIAQQIQNNANEADRIRQEMQNRQPKMSANELKAFFAKSQGNRPMTISGGGGCLGAFCSTNNAMKNVINVSKMNVNQIVEKIKELLLKAFTIGTPQEQSKKLMTEVSVYMDELVKQSKSTVPATRDAAMVAIINVKETVEKVRKNSIAQAADRHREINADQRRRYAEVQEMKNRAGIA